MNKEVKKPALSGAEGIVPELRFPEFESDGSWVQKPLIATADKKVKWSFTGGPFGSNLKASDYTESGFRIIQLQNIGDGEFNDDSKIFTSLEKANELLSCNIYAGDIIISKMGDPVGRACIIPTHLERCVMASDGIRLAVDEKNYSKYFVFSLINSKPIRKAIESKSTGSTRKRIGLNDLKEVQLTIPKNPKEQQKIADCLSSLDGVITAETEKLDLLQDHKKGLLQQLFPAEGDVTLSGVEGQPNYRFPELKEDGDSVEVVVDDDFEVCSSKRVLQQDWIQEGVPFYRTRELVSLSKNEPFGSEIFISESLFQKLSKKYGVPKMGDFLVSGVGTLGILYQVKENDKFYFKDGNVIWFKTGQNISSDYFKYCFQTQFVQKQIFSQSSASTVGTYTISNARKTKFWKPINNEEQQKIAACLSAADDLLEAQTKKIEALQEHKKGLLQHLFPNLNEVAV